jgi:hypothetical protein
MKNRLRLEDHVHIENILARRKIFGPVLNLDDVQPIDGSVLKIADKVANTAIDVCKSSFSISAEINYCFVGSAQSNAIAAYEPTVDKYFIIILIGALSVQEHLAPLLLRSVPRQLLDLKPLDPGETDPTHDANLGVLAGLSFYWLLCHELAHIKNGHLRLKEVAAFGVAAEEEMVVATDEDKNVTMHTLEMDADVYASGNAFHMLNLVREANPGCTILSSPLNMAKAFILSIYAMMRSFDLEKWSIEKLWEYNHPPAPIRVCQIGGWVFNFLEQHPEFRIKPTDWGEQSVTCIFTTEAELWGNPPKTLMAFEFVAKDFGAYGERLATRWEALKPYLKPYVLGGILSEQFPIK